MRIQKILSERGVASRRKGEELIRLGLVTVNGVPCSLGDTADPETDDIRVRGVPVPKPPKGLYILLHKPRGYVTTMSDEKGRRNVTQLVADCGGRVYPVGRLDMDSEGLLLLTNDGAFANGLMHPRHRVDKVYRVWVTGCTDAGLQKLSCPVTLDGYRIAAPQIQIVEPGERAVLEITIHEGRNRQVRRMCAMAGMQVRRLLRIREGGLTLGDLPRGAWRHLTPEEVALLKRTFL